MADYEKYLIYSMVVLLQIIARVTDLVTVWLLASFQVKQIPDTWDDEPAPRGGEKYDRGEARPRG